jgi:hypothetical protein
MDRQASQVRSKKNGAQRNVEDHRCILCDVIIESAEHDVFFATGRCRVCHETLESKE